MNKSVTEYNLNDEQFEQLMDKYVMTIVDSMSHEDFRQFVINTYYDDILSTLCVMNLLYNTGHSLQQLERIALIKSQSTETIMKGNCV